MRVRDVGLETRAHRLTKGKSIKERTLPGKSCRRKFELHVVYVEESGDRKHVVDTVISW